jgi:hypothetical protein
LIRSTHVFSKISSAHNFNDDEDPTRRQDPINTTISFFLWFILDMFLQFLLLSALLVLGSGFVTPAAFVAPIAPSSVAVIGTPASITFTSQLLLAAATVDPTAFLSDAFATLINTPVILFVPILAAVAVAAVIVYLINLSASPEVDDEE